jgi:HPt (histidine-containing phosphotransfer) domain-containing protein
MARPAGAARHATPGAAADQAVAAAIRARLAELIEDDDPDDVAFVARLARSFVQRAPGLLAAFTDALSAGDVEATAERAHALKGAASNVGADRVAQLCAEAEALARSGRLANVRGRSQRIAVELSTATRELSAAVTDLPRG